MLRHPSHIVAFKADPTTSSLIKAQRETVQGLGHRDWDTGAMASSVFFLQAPAPVLIPAPQMPLTVHPNSAFHITVGGRGNQGASPSYLPLRSPIALNPDVLWAAGQWTFRDLAGTLLLTPLLGRLNSWKTDPHPATAVPAIQGQACFCGKAASQLTKQPVCHLTAWKWVVMTLGVHFWEIMCLKSKIALALIPVWVPRGH